MSVTALHVLYKKEFEPLVRILENIAVARELDESRWEYYRVKYIEPFFPRHTTSTIPAGDYADVRIDALELHDDVLGHIRLVELSSGFEVEVSLPEAAKRHATRNTVTRIDGFIVSNYPHLTEVTYLADRIPVFRVYNVGGADAAATLRFVGFKYVLEKLPKEPREYTVVYVGSVVRV